MDALELARLQFGVTTVYHFFFVPLTLGLSIIVAIMHTQWVRTGDERYEKMTKFWGKLFLINFAMGVVTGIVQEFQFGMNWSEYSRFVGDIFGAPLAIEALMAFFLESTFLGLWIFGWGRLPQKVHLATIWLAALGANLSAYWILVANSFMQNPVGYEVVDGRATMTDFIALITNPNVLLQFPHVVLGGFVTGAFFVMGISAFHLLRGNRQTEENKLMFRRSFNIGMAFGLVAIVGTMFAGHAQGQHMADYQPMKLAAAEGIWEDEDPAGLSMFQIGDESSRQAIINIQIPSLLSLLTYDTPDGMVRGINSLNAEYQERFADRYDEAFAEQHGMTEVNYIPPAIWLTYWSFRAMVGAGVFMFVLILIGLFFRWRGTLLNRALYLRMMVLAILLPYVANTTGWLLTEFGRQPWIVFGEMRIEEAVSPNVGVGALLITLIGFTLIYGVLMAADIWLLWKYGSAGIDKGDGDAVPVEGVPQPDAQPAVSY
ncbi:MAG: cytochrome ubiquinol oxidase subunit I [Anaerolineaceae bacterium]|nr:MAG: cytochrome ubiquinol oxidase subunit I [Anaerolineaceae bacterium]